MEQMTGTFSEVFPALEIKTEITGELHIDRITINRKRDLLRIYLTANRCIPKQTVYALEKEIRAKLFSDSDIQVKIIEKFVLSGLYTPKLLMQEYESSIKLELEKQDRLMAHMFRTAKWEFPAENEISISIEESAVARMKEDEFFLWMDRIFNERCAMNVKLSLAYHPAKEQSDEAERQLRMAAKRITARTALARNAGENAFGQGESAASSAFQNEAGVSAVSEGDSAAGSTGTSASASAGASKAEGGSAAGTKAKASTASADGKIKKTASTVSGARGSKKSAYGKRNAKGYQKRDNASRFEKEKAEHPDLLFGRYFEEDSVSIETLDDSSGLVVIRGEISNLNDRTTRNESVLIWFTVSDGTDSVRAKLFVKGEDGKAMISTLKQAGFVKLKGTAAYDQFDHELTISSVYGILKIPNFREKKYDYAMEKRVELHCHSKMSDMDGITSAAALVRRAYEWGHPAIAITDHGGVQAFPEANHEMESIDSAYRKTYEKEHPEATKEELKKISAPFKVIYGMEGYLVDDSKGIAVGSKGQRLEDTFVVFDIETTGLSNETCKIIEIGAVRVEGGAIRDRFSTFVNPERPIPMKIEQLTSISDAMVEHAPKIEAVLPEFLEFCKGAVMVAHNAEFDMGFIIKECERQGFDTTFTYVDTIAMARILLPGLASFRLDRVAKAAGVVLGHHHRAVDDAACTADIFLVFIKMLAERDIYDLDRLNDAGNLSEEAKRKMRAHHVIILAKNEIGRVNLYRLVSESHMKYFYKNQAKLPKSLLEKYREGLIIGSACAAGEVYDSLLRGVAPAELGRIVSFYDYLEIQPIGNNAYLIADEKQDQIQSEKDLQEMNRKIVQLGKQFGKPVCATSDVHFMDPEDQLLRSIIMAGKKFKDADAQPPLYLHTTEEMLKECAYLGSDMAKEVVIDNPQKIAASIEKISPIRFGKFPPVIENSDRTLREICYRRAHEIYGDTLPDLVEKRLERELNSIISNGYAVMYIIAQKLVWKSNEDGYLVGSRGSVGSSFVATMSGITEVNPLPPHYLCPNCHYVDFDSEEVVEYGKQGKAGCDMPDATCPHCHTPLEKLGFSIPFETFLGFKGNKEPDIDLNFSGEYQSKAHKYTEVIFGEGQTYRAGTIGTLAEKTAYGYVKNYYADKNIYKRSCQIEHLAQHCLGIRRTSGQHPGGIIVLPIGEDINSFTPIQHPADDMSSDIVTTHFDYHSIDSNLLKLDILGHDDPTMIRMLEDLTGTDAKSIPLDEPKVMSLFKNTEALGVTPEQIRGCPLGSLGIPEFGTDFVIQMLQDTKPQCFSDLIRISGLSHGTDVWLGNAQKLIEEGNATISTAICTRDDIMTYLISMGLESEMSFTIMEKVRKGKGLTPEWEKEMAAHGVPDWYIWSCNKIKYMFPKAHAVAYVMMAYRIAWYKIYYPLAYYAAFFSIRSSTFNYEKMCMGQSRLEEHMNDMEARKDTLTNLEKDMAKEMKSVQEMYARGYEFMPIDLYQVQAHRFSIVDGKLMPALDTIDGLGGKAADAIVLAARDGAFLSKEDFRRRTKIGKTVTDTLERIGVLEGLPEGDQISMFDMVM